MTHHHLAQCNVATMLAAADDPVMAGFFERLEELNALADRSPGFVWRLKTDDGDATAIRVFNNPRILFNLSVWESPEALDAYVYRSDHVTAVRQRAAWFEPAKRSPLVLWWIPAGHLPDVEEARERLELLWENGPQPDAFTFSKRFLADGTPA
jgi:hypothetical protein